MAVKYDVFMICAYRNVLCFTIDNRAREAFIPEVFLEPLQVWE